jgi:hypothetical protein
MELFQPLEQSVSVTETKSTNGLYSLSQILKQKWGLFSL